MLNYMPMQMNNAALFQQMPMQTGWGQYPQMQSPMYMQQAASLAQMQQGLVDNQLLGLQELNMKSKVSKNKEAYDSCKLWGTW
jgi:hypothetical protein